MKRLIVTAALALILPMSVAHAQAAPAMQDVIGPAIGSVIPDFSATTIEGEILGLHEISGEQGSVLVFSRSLDWCPYCQVQARDLQGIAAELEEAGWPVSLITYDDPDIHADFAARHAISYALLSDRGSKMIDAFGLRNSEMKPGSRFDGVPHPAILFVSADGTLAALQREDGYKERPPIEGILEEVNRLNALD